mmetsp:Transcript_21182/g.46212  ORF Transcript_21182/g.46212 Transcript_21182/m.46212 type:complete len:197 (-) Transcript_21182:196-786(-)
MMKLTGDFGKDTPLSNRYCSRGLEDFDPEQQRKGSGVGIGCVDVAVKTTTTQRRRGVIGAVLHEQCVQQQHHQQRSAMQQEQQQQQQLGGNMQQRRVPHHNNGRGIMNTNYRHQRQPYMVQKHGCSKLMDRRRRRGHPQQQQQQSSRQKCILDHFRISLIYMNLSHHDTMEGIDLGRQDSEEALDIYRTKPFPSSL